MAIAPHVIAQHPHSRDPATALSYDLHGYRAALTIPDGAARSLMRTILRGFGPHPDIPAAIATKYALRRGDDNWWEVAVADQLVYRSSELADAVVAVEWHLVTSMLADRGDHFHVHAAALAAPSSSTSVLIPGASGSGKTTLALGLMARGFLPYSDDVTLMDPDTRAPMPFPRAFHIDEQTQSLLLALPSPPAWDFGGMPPGYFLVSDWAPARWPIRTVLFPRLAPGELPRLDPLSVAEAAMRLLPFSTTLRQCPSLALRVVARIVAQARCYELVTGDLAATIDLVGEQVLQYRRKRDT